MGFFTDKINRKQGAGPAPKPSGGGSFFSGSVQAHQERMTTTAAPPRLSIRGKVTDPVNLLKQAPTPKQPINLGLNINTSANSTPTTAPKTFDAVEFVRSIARDTLIRFPASVGEEVGRQALRLAGSDKADIQTPPRDTILGPVETYQSATKRRIAEGEDPTMAILKEGGSALLDEPLGVAAKPVLAFGGLAFKVISGKFAKEAAEKAAQQYDALAPAFEQTKLDLDDIIKNTAKEYGGVPVTVPLKSKERVIEKVVMEYGGDFSRLTDLARGSVIVPNSETAKKIFDDLTTKSDVVVRAKDRTTSPGYQDVLINVRTSNGNVAELQALTPAMFYGKMLPETSRATLGEKVFAQFEKTGIKPGEGHEIYEEARKLFAKAKRTAEDQARLTELKKSEITYYSRLREAESRLLNSSSVTTSTSGEWPKTPRPMISPANADASSSEVAGSTSKLVEPPSSLGNNLKNLTSSAPPVNIANTGLEKSVDIPAQYNKADDVANLPKVEQRAISAIPEFTAPENIAKLRGRNRGTITDKEAYETARSLGITEDEVLKFPVGKILTKEEKTAVSGLVQNAVESLRSVEANLPKALLTPEDVASRRIVEQYALQKVKVMKLLTVERGIAAETGRALQAHKMLAQSISDEEARMAKYLSDPKIPQENKDYILDMISRNGNDPDAMRDLLRKLNDPTIMEMIVEFSTAIKLYGIPTHLVNVLTSATRVLLNIPIRATSGAVDSALAKLTGRGQERYAREALLEATGQWQGWKESWKDALKALSDENYAIEARKIQDVTPKGPAIRGRLGKDTAFDSFLDSFGKGVRVSFRALGAEDMLIRGPAERGAAYVLIGRAAMKQGIKPGTPEFEKFVAENVFQPKGEVIEQMVKMADEALFQADLSPSMQAVNNIRNEFPTTKLIVPFFKTLNNLIKQSIQFTPVVSYALPSSRKALASGGGEHSDVIAKQIIGVSVLLPLSMYAMEDRITLGAPKNAGERDQFYAEGKQPYSILIGDTWYPYARFSPFSEWLVSAGLIAQSVKNDDEKRMVEVLTDAFFTMSQNMLDKTFVSGLNDLLGALTDPNKAENWIENFVTGATLPTIVGGAARSIDPVVREAEGIKEAYMARIPGLSDNLPARTDVFGNDIVRPGSALERFASPIVPSPVKVDLVRKELTDMDYVIGFPSQSAFGIDLTKEQHRQLKAASGKVIYNALYEIFTTPDFDALPPGKKEEVVQTVVNRARTRVKEKLFPEIELQKAIKDRLEERGMSSEDAEKKALEVYEKIKADQTQAGTQ